MSPQKACATSCHIRLTNHRHRRFVYCSLGLAWEAQGPVEEAVKEMVGVFFYDLVFGASLCEAHVLAMLICCYASWWIKSSVVIYHPCTFEMKQSRTDDGGHISEMYIRPAQQFGARNEDARDCQHREYQQTGRRGGKDMRIERSIDIF